MTGTLVAAGGLACGCLLGFSLARVVGPEFATAAAGDQRSGDTRGPATYSGPAKRVDSTVSEGPMAIRTVHEHLTGT